MLKSAKAFLLAGASALAILVCAADANAETFTMPGMFSFAASVSGEYALDLLGASGGNTTLAGGVGGHGAEVSGDIFLTAGDDLTLFVGGLGGSKIFAGGGGGGSFVFLGTEVLAVAGGGGGGGGNSIGGPGLAGTSGGTGGGGIYGGAGGANGNGGGGGSYRHGGNGGGGAGVNPGGAGSGGDGVDGVSGTGRNFPQGGNGADPVGGFGGYGGGGGGGLSGGGGSGFSGGGGGGDSNGGNAGGGGGGGGGSYLVSLFTDRVLTPGVNYGNGSISVDLLRPSPNPRPGRCWPRASPASAYSRICASGSSRPPEAPSASTFLAWRRTLLLFDCGDDPARGPWV